MRSAPSGAGGGGGGGGRSRSAFSAPSGASDGLRASLEAPEAKSRPSELQRGGNERERSGNEAGVSLSTGRSRGGGERPALSISPGEKARKRGRAPKREEEDVPMAQLSPRSRRKRRNRDQMRLVRQKEKENMDQLRATVARMEATYRRLTLSAGSAAAAARRGDGRAAETSQYAQLVAESSRLTDENFRLRHAVDDKFKLQETLERVYSDCLEPLDESKAPLPPSSDDSQDESEAFTPLSSEYIWARMRGTFTQANAIRQRLQTDEEQPPFFGWRVMLRASGRWLMFSFDKPFPHVTAEEAVAQMWAHERAMHSYRSTIERSRQTMRIVQEVNDDTYVFQRRMCPESNSTRPVVSTYMRFRLKTPGGYAIGTTSVMPTMPISSEDDDERQEGDDGGGGGDAVWAADLSFYTEFQHMPSAYGRDYCVARISGRTNIHGSGSQHRAAADLVIGLLRWENANIGPMFTFAS